MEILEPWYKCSDTELLAELRNELPPGHVLFDVELDVVAKRQDRDDVLFRFLDGSGKMASVHLSFQKESDPQWPSTRIYESMSNWWQTMQSDHAEFGS